MSTLSQRLGFDALKTRFAKSRPISRRQACSMSAPGRERRHGQRPRLFHR